MRATIKLMTLLMVVFFIVGCASMTPTQQRMLSGGAIGAGTGAAIGAISGGSPAVGAAVGGAAGVVGGAIVDQMYKGRP